VQPQKEVTNLLFSIGKGLVFHHILLNTYLLSHLSSSYFILYLLYIFIHSLFKSYLEFYIFLANRVTM